MNAVLLSPAWLFAPTSLWRDLSASGAASFALNTEESLDDSGYSSRYTIATAAGPLSLTVPLSGGKKKARRVPLSQLRIDYTHRWRQQHWGAIYSAYGRAPFFEHYAPGLKALLDEKHSLLSDLNMASMSWLARSLRLGISFVEQTTESFSGESGSTQLLQLSSVVPATPYHQVFDSRWGFIPDLSAIDLLMNEGPDALRFLL